MEAELAVKEIATVTDALQNMKRNESSALVANQREVVPKVTSSVIEQAIAQFEMEKENGFVVLA